MRRDRTFQLSKNSEKRIEEGTAGCLLSWPRTFSLFSRRGHGGKKKKKLERTWLATILDAVRIVAPAPPSI